MIMNKFILVLAVIGVSISVHSNLVYADTTLPAVPNAHASSNWSGYVASTGYYTSVGATWTIPVPGKAPITDLSGDATWVGIGGLATAKDLVQAGTQAVVVNGVVTYQAWYETLPNNETITTLHVSGGDTVSTSVRETSPTTWHITITNQTRHISFEKDITYTSTHATAEWIEERPIAISDTSNGYLPLDQFGSVDFTSAYAVSNGAQSTLAGSDPEALMMVNAARNALATPSTIGNDDSSFTVRQASGMDQMTESIPMTQTLSDPQDTSGNEIQTQRQYVVPVVRFSRFPFIQKFSPGGFDIEVFTTR